jgi:hypothetical protein
MRIIALAMTSIAMLGAAAPARAQTYDPAYPVCMHVHARINYYDCRYTSLPQCAVSAAGRAAQCVVNPYYAGGGNPRRRRHHVRHW